MYETTVPFNIEIDDDQGGFLDPVELDVEYDYEPEQRAGQDRYGWDQYFPASVSINRVYVRGSVNGDFEASPAQVDWMVATGLDDVVLSRHEEVVI